MRAIRLRKTQIVKELMIEAAVVSVVGGVVGWVAGMVLSWLILPYFSQSSTTLQVDPNTAIGAVLVALLLGALSTVYPAIRASRLDPAEAVRYV